MNNLIKYSATGLATMLIAVSATAQDKKDKSAKDVDGKTQEIIIRKKGGNSNKMTIVVDGDKVTINGKPADDFKNEDVTIFRRDREMAGVPHVRRMISPRPPFSPDVLEDLGSFNSNRGLLGVMTTKADDGAKVVEVTDESGAEKAGLKKDDIITKVGDTKVEDSRDLVKAISGYKPNDKVDLTYKRDGKENKVTA